MIDYGIIKPDIKYLETLIINQFLKDLHNIEKQNLMGELKKLTHIGAGEWFERMDFCISMSNQVFILGLCGAISFEEFQEAMAEVIRSETIEWNIEDKKIIGYDSEGKMFCSVLKKGNLQKLVKEDDLETLRIKLIEELDKYLLEMHRNVLENKDYFMNSTSIIINKLFGVK